MPAKKPKIVISKFCLDREQRYCEIPLEKILPEISRKFSKAKPRYRKGVIAIPLTSSPA